MYNKVNRIRIIRASEISKIDSRFHLPLASQSSKHLCFTFQWQSENIKRQHVEKEKQTGRLTESRTLLKIVDKEKFLKDDTNKILMRNSVRTFSAYIYLHILFLIIVQVYFCIVFVCFTVDSHTRSVHFSIKF